MGVATRARLFVRGTTKAVTPPVMAVLLLVPAASAALVSSVSSEGVLTVQSDASDAIVVTCSSDGNVKVNGVNPDTGSTACSAITTIRVTGGDGPNVIDLSGVTRVSFPNLHTDGPLRVSVSGNVGADTITGSEWSDDLSAGPGDDSLIGGEGDDSLFASVGNDRIEGGLGVDRFVLFGTDADDTITVLEGDGHVTTAQETDAYSSIEVFSLRGQAGNDTITSGAGADTIRGGEGNDVLNGGAGDDFVFGDAGPGPLPPASGNDVLNGGTGADQIWGESGNDEITSRDGSADIVQCGSETDSVLADVLDETIECEAVDLGIFTPPPLQPVPPSQPVPPFQPVPPLSPPAPPPPAQLRCVVPNVRGNTLGAAKAALRKRRCSAGKVSRVYSKVKSGKVVAQRPRAGTRLAVGAKVRLTVSRGRRP